MKWPTFLAFALALIAFHLAAIGEKAENIFIVSASHIWRRGTSTGLNVSFHSAPLDPYRDPLRYVHVTRGALFISVGRFFFYLSISAFGSLTRRPVTIADNFIRNFDVFQLKFPLA